MARHEAVMGILPRSPQDQLDKLIDKLLGRLPAVMESLRANMVDGKYPEYSESVFRKRPITFSDGRRRQDLDTAYVQSLSATKDKQGYMRDKDGRFIRQPRLAVPVWYAGIAVLDDQPVVVDSQNGIDGVYGILDLSTYPRTWNIGSIIGITDVLLKPPAVPLGMG